MRAVCGCPPAVGPDAPVGEYCDDCHQLVREGRQLVREEAVTDREKLLEAERLVREVIEDQRGKLGAWESAMIEGRLTYVADTLIDTCKEVTV